MLCCALIAVLLAPLGFLVGRRGAAGRQGAGPCCAPPGQWVLALIGGLLLAELALFCLLLWPVGAVSAASAFHHICWAAGLGAKP